MGRPWAPIPFPRPSASNLGPSAPTRRVLVYMVLGLKGLKGLIGFIGFRYLGFVV